MNSAIAGHLAAAYGLLAQLFARSSVLAGKGHHEEAKRISVVLNDLDGVIDAIAADSKRLVPHAAGEVQRPNVQQADGAAALAADRAKHTMAEAYAARAVAEKYREKAEKYSNNAEAARKNAEAQLQDLNQEATRQRAEAKRRRAFLKMDIKLRSYSRAMKLVDPSGSMVSRTETPGGEQLARFSKAVQVATQQLKTAIENRNAAQREVDTAKETRDILNGWLKDVERAEGGNGDA